MSIDKEMIPQLLRDLKVNRDEIYDAHQILNLNRDGKWSYRLLLLSYLLKGDEFQKIREFVDFAFLKNNDDSLFQIFDFKRIRSKVAMPEKWFENKDDDNYITGSKNARSTLSERPDLFTKSDSGYGLNETNGSDKLALILFIYLLNAQSIDITKITEDSSEENESSMGELYERFFLTDSAGEPTSLLYQVQNLIDLYPDLTLEDDIDKDTETILPHIQTVILTLLQKHPYAFMKSPYKKKKIIVFESIYKLSAYAEDERFNISNWLNCFSSVQDRHDSSDDDIDDSVPTPSVLVGSAGSGKSFWMIQQAADLWNQCFKPGNSEKREWIPIVLELGSVFLDKTTHGEALVYGEQKYPIRYSDEEPDKTPGRSLIDRSLGAILNKSSQYVRKILDRVDWHDKKFVFLLDGWDELGNREKKEMTKFIDSCSCNQIPCIVSSRIRDSYLETLEPEYFMLEKPSLDNYTEYLLFRGMEEAVLDKIGKWFPNPSPLDLEILGRVPRMEEISYGRVPVYRTWIELQVLSYIRKDIPHDLVSRSKINQIIEHKFYDGKPLFEWIRDRNNPHSVWNYLPYIAYLQRDGKHTSLSYDRVIEENPLLKELLEKRYDSGDSPYPEISRNHLIPYLSAEYIIRKYLVGSYTPIQGDSHAFEFLVEILSFESEREHEGELVERSVDLTPIEVASMICIQSESRAHDSFSFFGKCQHLKQNRITESTPFYTALFHGFVRYWSLSLDRQLRRIILSSFAKLIQTIIIEGKEDNPADYIIPILEIEQKFESIDITKLVTTEPDKSIDLEVLDSLGYTIYYLDYNRVQDSLVKISRKRPWLTPWTVRLVETEIMPRIREIVNEINEEYVIYSVIFHVTSGFSSISDEWFGSLHDNARRLESSLLWNSLAYGLSKTQSELDDKFQIFLNVIGSSKVEDKWKLELICSLKKERLPQRLVREVWRSTEQGEIDSKYGIAICLSQELPNVTMDDIFDAISKSKGLGWLNLLLPGILDEKYDEEDINIRFIKFSFSIIQSLKRIRIAPWDEDRLASLVDIWWESNLQNIEDALKFIQIISKWKREDRLATLDYRETEVLERLVSWLNNTRKSTRKKFFRKLIESDIDMTDLSVRQYLYPLYREIEDRTDLDDLLVERYPSYLRGMQTLPLSKVSWKKHIDKVDHEEILDWSWLMEIYLEAGFVTSIDEAKGLLDEIKNLHDYLIETFTPLSQWVLQRPINEIANFTLHLLKEFTTFHRRGFWQIVNESGLIDALTPVEKNSPELYARILEITREMPALSIYVRSELQFLFEQLSSEDKLSVVRPHMEKFLRDESFLLRKSLAEIILMHGKKKDVDILIQSLNDEPRSLGNIWLKNMKRTKQISRRLTNPLSILLYEMDLVGGWEEYKKQLEKDPKKAEQDLLLFLKSDWISWGFHFLTSGGVLRDIALKHWKKIFLRDKTSIGEGELYLGDLFQDDNEEILEYIAGEIDRIHRDIIESEKEEPREYRTRWYSWEVSALNKIRDRCGYSGLKKLLSRVKEPYAIEGVMTYLVGAAKKEGVPKSEIQSMKEYGSLTKATRWNLLKNYDD
jgi:hypothetical protein